MKRIAKADLKHAGSSHHFVGADHGVAISSFLYNGVKGSGPGPHRHPYDEIQFIQSGRARYLVEGAEFEAGAGEILVIKAGEVHGFTVISRLRKDAALLSLPQTKPAGQRGDESAHHEDDDRGACHGDAGEPRHLGAVADDVGETPQPAEMEDNGRDERQRGEDQNRERQWPDQSVLPQVGTRWLLGEPDAQAIKPLTGGRCMAKVGPQKKATPAGSLSPAEIKTITDQLVVLREKIMSTGATP